MVCSLVPAPAVTRPVEAIGHSDPSQSRVETTKWNRDHGQRVLAAGLQQLKHEKKCEHEQRAARQHRSDPDPQ